MPQSILLIEDDAAFRKTLAKLLDEEGFSTRQAAAGKAGVAAALAEAPDLVILDLGLPGIGGQQVCRLLKEEVRTAGVPVLILTGQDKDGQEISCLDLGADDYLTKPVSPQRLLARCRALLRRASSGVQPAESDLRLGGLHFDQAGKAVSLDGRRVAHLTPKEFDVLYDLASHHPAPRDRVALYRQVWGMEPPSEGSLRTVEVHVRRIRLKMGWAAGEWLVTVASRGYRLAPPA